MLGKRFIWGPAGLEPPTGARIRKKIQKKGGGIICASRAQQGREPKNQMNLHSKL